MYFLFIKYCSWNTRCSVCSAFTFSDMFLSFFSECIFRLLDINFINTRFFLGSHLSNICLLCCIEKGDALIVIYILRGRIYHIYHIRRTCKSVRISMNESYEEVILPKGTASQCKPCITFLLPITTFSLKLLDSPKKPLQLLWIFPYFQK